MKRENSFVGRGKKREELRKWTILNAVDLFRIAIGGENDLLITFQQGVEAPLEEMLPVDMDLKTEGQNSDLTMIMVIDRTNPDPSVFIFP